jgi:cyanophycinase-like exopeptidase
MKRAFYWSVLLFVITLLIPWSGCRNFQAPEHETTGGWQLLVTGNAVPNYKIVEQITQKSGVYQKGYVVVVDFNPSENIKQKNRIIQLFYQHKINAVHLLKINLSSPIKPSDLLAIENAGALFLLPIKMKRQASLLNNVDLIKALKSAFQKGAFMAVKGNELSKLTGTIYYHQRKDSVKGNTMVRQHKGLGLVNNTVVDRLPFYTRFKKGIINDVKAGKFMFIALGNKSMVLIGNGSAMVSGGDKVGVMMPEKPLSFYKKGEQFSLQP